MKRAVSISLGSPTRDKAVEINLLGETVRIERIGTNGDAAKARQMFREMDGKVDAFGLGGTISVSIRRGNFTRSMMRLRWCRM